MEYRQLGNTDLRLSAITYGSFAIGGTMWGGTKKREAIDAIRASIDHGVTSLDTAPFYGFGLSEELISEAVQGLDRSRLQILTKFGMVWDGSNNGKGDFMWNQEYQGNSYAIYKYASKANVIKEAEESLRRLKTDYIDLLQLHWPDSTTPIEDTMDGLQQLIKQGKILAAGVSNFDAPQMAAAQQYIALASNQVPYSMLKREIEKDLIPAAIKSNVGIIAYSPLERGLLTGKFFHGKSLQSDDHRNDYFRQFEPDKVKTLLQSLEPLAKAKGVTIGQLVLKWTTVQPGITAVLAGARNREQAISNAAAINIGLTEDELELIARELEIYNTEPGR